MRIAIYGVGGVGGYFGGRLAQAGERVIFFARGEHLLALQHKGLRVESISGDFTVNPINATDQVENLRQADFILLGVKAWQVVEAAKALRPILADHACVVPLQNGVDAPAQLAEILGDEHVLCGLCQISAYKVEPGIIRHAGIQPKIIFAELDGSPSARVNQLRQCFEHAGVNVDTPTGSWAALWRKFLFITAVSGVGAVTRVPLGVVRSIPEVRHMLVQAMQEVADLAAARSIQLEPDIVSKTIAGIDNMAADVIPSMQRDIMEGRPSELESQNGAVVRMARESSISAPTHAFIYTSLFPQEMQARRNNPPG